MPFTSALIWKKAPFIRLLIPFTTGIIIQWYCQISFFIAVLVFITAFVMAFITAFLPFVKKLKFSWLTGCLLNAIFFAGGCLLAWQGDIRNNDKWFDKSLTPDAGIVVTLLEDPIEKTKSYKADARVSYLIENGNRKEQNGKIILYFAKDSFPVSMTYGSIVLLNKLPQEIQHAGNPGSFDYKRYCLFKGITHQVFLTSRDFTLLREKDENWLVSFLGSIRKNVLNVIRRYIPGTKESGLAEALLIGYKDDLDKTLFQSYANTGVVHIIVISGLHVGLIYWLLLTLSAPLSRRKQSRWLRPTLIIAGLWLFALLAGANPPVLRATVMFTSIVAGDLLNRKVSIYNSLAASAFLLLCYNPYWIFHVGFQLSYTAVLSIVLFFRHIYNWLYVRNKILDFFWQVAAVSIAVQVLAFPLLIFHFHQYPVFFLLANFIAVPLASLILIGEILLCVSSFIPLIAIIIGKILSFLIWLMNTWIERVEALPYSLWPDLYITVVQAILLFCVIASLSWWLLEKQKKGLLVALIALPGFVTLRSISFIQSQRQQKIIVYNVPGKKAIDIIDGNEYLFIGNNKLQEDDFTRNFYLNPARVLNRTHASTVNKISPDEKFLTHAGKKIMLLDEKIQLATDTTAKPAVDLLVLSGNPKLYLSNLTKSISIAQVVFDGSVPNWKSRYWKKDCDSLHIPWHDVSEKGAFVMNLR